MNTLVASKKESCRGIRDFFFIGLDFLITPNAIRMLLRFSIVQIIVAIAIPIFAENTSCTASTEITQTLKSQNSCTCNSLDLHIEGKIVEDFQDVCTAALAVASFYRDVGLAKVPTMHVTIVDKISLEVGTDVLGYFDPESGGIHILSYFAASKCRNLFERHMDRALYRSRITSYNVCYTKLLR